MTQTFLAWADDRVLAWDIPSAKAHLLPGVPWGRFESPFTPAFWYCRVQHTTVMQANPHYTLGLDLRQEVVACLLGGYGMPAEMGMAAFQRLVSRDLLESIPVPDTSQIESCLAEPFNFGDRTARYRYPRQRAGYVSDALQRLSEEEPPRGDIALRDWLLTFSGIGPKTASWITRNQRHSDSVAILDVHVHRAGILAGVFPRTSSPQREYPRLERRFLEFARALGLQASKLDAVIWRDMRDLSTTAHAAMRRVGLD